MVFAAILVFTGCSTTPAHINGTSMVGLETQITSTAIESADISNNILDLSNMSVDEWASTSPSGQWVATGLVALPKLSTNGEQTSNMSFTRVMIFSTQAIVKWTVIEKWSDFNLGFPFPKPLAWSSDEDTFYLTNTVTPDGCGAFDYRSGLARVDLNNGNVADLLPTSSSAWVSLSPDKTSLAYIGVGGRGLVLRDLQTGAEEELNIDPGKDYQAGHILWSPNGGLLALTLVTNPCGDINELHSSILLVDAETLAVRFLLQEDPRFLITKEWTEAEEIFIVDGTFADATLEDVPYNSRWRIDINSGVISPEIQ